MNKISVLLVVVCIFSSSYAQVKNMGASTLSNNRENWERSKEGIDITKETVRLLTIGIGGFKDPKFEALKSVSTLSRYKIVSENYLRLSYHNHPTPTFLNGSTVKSHEVREALSNLALEAEETDVIIISILSHGEIKDGEYYLICTDTDSRNYSGTAISGTEIRYYLQLIADKGAIVLLFIDTCHAAAVFENTSYSPKSNGSIAYFASSKSNQSAKEINQLCRFTETILDILQNKNKHAFNENGFVTIKSLGAQINAALSAITTPNQQQPISKYFTNNDHFEDYPIIKEKEFVPPPTIWQNPKPFSPFSVSPNNSKWIDYCLIGVEMSSLIGMIVCGPILQSYYKNNIDKEKDLFLRNDYREKGKTVAKWFCVSTGLLVTSYTIKALHVHKQLSIEHKKKQLATLDILPLISIEENGLALVLKF